MLKRSVKGLREQLQQEHELDFSPQISALREEGSSADENTLFSVSVLMVKSGDPAHVREGLASLEKLSFKIVKTVTSECAEKLGFPANDVGSEDQVCFVAFLANPSAIVHAHVHTRHHVTTLALFIGQEAGAVPLLHRPRKVQAGCARRVRWMLRQDSAGCSGLSPGMRSRKKDPHTHTHTYAYAHTGPHSPLPCDRGP